MMMISSLAMRSLYTIIDLYVIFAIIVMQTTNTRLETCIFKMRTNQTFVKKFKNSINIYACVRNLQFTIIMNHNVCHACNA